MISVLLMKKSWIHNHRTIRANPGMWVTLTLELQNIMEERKGYFQVLPNIFVLGSLFHEQKDTSLSLIFLCVCVCVQHVRYYFPDQGSNTSPALGAQSLNHWTTREVPLSFLSSHFLTFISLHCSPRTPDLTLWKWYLGLSDTGICFFLKNTVCISDDNFAGSQSFIIGIKHPQK